MTPRVLVAGLGNVLHGDDGFGVEVARRLAEQALPDSALVRDFGIRGIHLAFEIIGGAYDLVMFVDACPVDGNPGSLIVIDAEDVAPSGDAIEGHDLDPATVLRLVSRLGGPVPRVLVVGCEPGDLDGIGLTPPVEAAVDEAIGLITRLIDEESADVSGRTGTSH